MAIGSTVHGEGWRRVPLERIRLGFTPPFSGQLGLHDSSRSMIALSLRRLWQGDFFPIIVPVVLVIVSSLSCAPKARWQPTQMRPERFQERKSPARATVVLVTGESLLVEKPVLSHDSLLGAWPHGSRRNSVPAHRRSDGDSTGRYAVPTSEISAILVDQEPAPGAGGVIFVLVWTAAAVMGVFLFPLGIP